MFLLLVLLITSRYYDMLVLLITSRYYDMLVLLITSRYYDMLPCTKNMPPYLVNTVLLFSILGFSRSCCGWEFPIFLSWFQ